MVEWLGIPGCVNLQSEQSIDSHHGVASVLIAIATIVSKLTETSKSKRIQKCMQPFLFGQIRQLDGWYIHLVCPIKG
jgi:hypothetical protein